MTHLLKDYRITCEEDAKTSNIKCHIIDISLRQKCDFLSFLLNCFTYLFLYEACPHSSVDKKNKKKNNA